MGVESTTRVIRGGRALETIYWHYTKGKGGVKLIKHGKTLVYPKKQAVPKAPNVADQAFRKIH